MVERKYEPKFYPDEELKNKSGIYQIRNLVDNKLYIGSANNLYRRKNNQHLYELRKNIHCNNKLQNAFNDFGEQNFIFEIIEFVEDEDKLLKIEQYWMDRFNVVKNGYNKTPIAGKGPVYKKAVICLETSNIYDSTTQASQITGFARSAIGENCNNRTNACKGYHFMFYDDFLKLNEAEVLQKMLIEGRHKKIICLNTGELLFR